MKIIIIYECGNIKQEKSTKRNNTLCNVFSTPERREIIEF